MSRLDDLLAHLCPDGVEYKELGTIGTFYGGLSGKTKDDFGKGDAKYITYMNVYSNLSVDTYIFDRVDVAANEKQNTVAFGDVLFTGSSETPDECGMSSVMTQKIDEIVYLNSFCFGYRFDDADLMLPDFSKYVFRSEALRKQIKKTASGVTRFNVSKKKMEKVSIPLPPLPVQAEIVRILDNFTELTAELSAELSARRKQYEYYRDQMLTFGDEVEWQALGDVIISLNTGLNPRQFFRLNTEDARNYYITIREIRGGKILPSDKTDMIDDEALKLCNNRSNLEKGDVLFSGTGTIGETAVIEQPPSNWNIKEGVYTIKPMQDKILSKFLRYILMSEPIRLSYMKKVAGGTVKSIPMGEMRKLSIPLPPLAEQKRIVDILDRFDSLCNDITAGLPAEIEARRKQYEYYRDRLLAFDQRH